MLYQLLFWLWASQAFEPLELHKLTNYINQRGIFFLLLFGRKLSFSKNRTMAQLLAVHTSSGLNQAECSTQPSVFLVLSQVVW